MGGGTSRVGLGGEKKRAAVQVCTATFSFEVAILMATSIPDEMNLKTASSQMKTFL